MSSEKSNCVTGNSILQKSDKKQGLQKDKLAKSNSSISFDLERKHPRKISNTKLIESRNRRPMNCRARHNQTKRNKNHEVGISQHKPGTRNTEKYFPTSNIKPHPCECKNCKQFLKLKNNGGHQNMDERKNLLKSTKTGSETKISQCEPKQENKYLLKNKNALRSKDNTHKELKVSEYDSDFSTNHRAQYYYNEDEHRRKVQDTSSDYSPFSSSSSCIVSPWSKIRTRKKPRKRSVSKKEKRKREKTVCCTFRNPNYASSDDEADSLYLANRSIKARGKGCEKSHSDYIANKRTYEANKFSNEEISEVKTRTSATSNLKSRRDESTQTSTKESKKTKIYTCCYKHPKNNEEDSFYKPTKTKSFDNKEKYESSKTREPNASIRSLDKKEIYDSKTQKSRPESHENRSHHKPTDEPEDEKEKHKSKLQQTNAPSVYEQEPQPQKTSTCCSRPSKSKSSNDEEIHGNKTQKSEKPFSSCCKKSKPDEEESYYKPSEEPKQTKSTKSKSSDDEEIHESKTQKSKKSCSSCFKKSTPDEDESYYKSSEEPKQTKITKSKSSDDEEIHEGKTHKSKKPCSSCFKNSKPDEDESYYKPADETKQRKTSACCSRPSKSKPSDDEEIYESKTQKSEKSCSSCFKKSKPNEDESYYKPSEEPKQPNVSKSKSSDNEEKYESKTQKSEKPCSSCCKKSKLDEDDSYYKPADETKQTKMSTCCSSPAKSKSSDGEEIYEDKSQKSEKTCSSCCKKSKPDENESYYKPSEELKQPNVTKSKSPDDEEIHKNKTQKSEEPCSSCCKKSKPDEDESYYKPADETKQTKISSCCSRPTKSKSSDGEEIYGSKTQKSEEPYCSCCKKSKPNEDESYYKPSEEPKQTKITKSKTPDEEKYESKARKSEEPCSSCCKKSKPDEDESYYKPADETKQAKISSCCSRPTKSKSSDGEEIYGSKTQKSEEPCSSCCKKSKPDEDESYYKPADETKQAKISSCCSRPTKSKSSDGEEIYEDKTQKSEKTCCSCCKKSKPDEDETHYKPSGEPKQTKITKSKTPDNEEMYENKTQKSEEPCCSCCKKSKPDADESYYKPAEEAEQAKISSCCSRPTKSKSSDGEEISEDKTQKSEKTCCSCCKKSKPDENESYYKPSGEPKQAKITKSKTPDNEEIYENKTQKSEEPCCSCCKKSKPDADESYYKPAEEAEQTRNSICCSRPSKSKSSDDDEIYGSKTQKSEEPCCSCCKKSKPDADESYYKPAEEAEQTRNSICCSRPSKSKSSDDDEIYGSKTQKSEEPCSSCCTKSKPDDDESYYKPAEETQQIKNSICSYRTSKSAESVELYEDRTQKSGKAYSTSCRMYISSEEEIFYKREPQQPTKYRPSEFSNNEDYYKGKTQKCHEQCSCCCIQHQMDRKQDSIPNEDILAPTTKRQRRSTPESEKYLTTSRRNSKGKPAYSYFAGESPQEERYSNAGETCNSQPRIKKFYYFDNKKPISSATEYRAEPAVPKKCDCKDKILARSQQEKLKRKSQTYSIERSPIRSKKKMKPQAAPLQETAAKDDPYAGYKMMEYNTNLTKRERSRCLIIDNKKYPPDRNVLIMLSSQKLNKFQKSFDNSDYCLVQELSCYSEDESCEKEIRSTNYDSSEIGTTNMLGRSRGGGNDPSCSSNNSPHLSKHKILCCSIDSTNAVEENKRVNNKSHCNCNSVSFSELRSPTNQSNHRTYDKNSSGNTYAPVEEEQDLCDLCESDSSLLIPFYSEKRVDRKSSLKTVSQSNSQNSQSKTEPYPCYKDAKSRSSVRNVPRSHSTQKVKTTSQCQCSRDTKKRKVPVTQSVISKVNYKDSDEACNMDCDSKSSLLLPLYTEKEKGKINNNKPNSKLFEKKKSCQCKKNMTNAASLQNFKRSSRTSLHNKQSENESRSNFKSTVPSQIDKPTCRYPTKFKSVYLDEGKCVMDKYSLHMSDSNKNLTSREKMGKEIKTPNTHNRNSEKFSQQKSISKLRTPFGKSNRSSKSAKPINYDSKGKKQEKPLAYREVYTSGVPIEDRHNTTVDNSTCKCNKKHQQHFKVIEKSASVEDYSSNPEICKKKKHSKTGDSKFKEERFRSKHKHTRPADHGISKKRNIGGNCEDELDSKSSKKGNIFKKCFKVYEKDCDGNDEHSEDEYIPNSNSEQFNKPDSSSCDDDSCEAIKSFHDSMIPPQSNPNRCFRVVERICSDFNEQEINLTENTSNMGSSKMEGFSKLLPKLSKLSSSRKCINIKQTDCSESRHNYNSDEDSDAKNLEPVSSFVSKKRMGAHKMTDCKCSNGQHSLPSRHNFSSERSDSFDRSNTNSYHKIKPHRNNRLENDLTPHDGCNIRLIMADDISLNSQQSLPSRHNFRSERADSFDRSNNNSHHKIKPHQSNSLENYLKPKNGKLHDKCNRPHVMTDHISSSNQQRLPSRHSFSSERADLSDRSNTNSHHKMKPHRRNSFENYLKPEEEKFHDKYNDNPYRPLSNIRLKHSSSRSESNSRYNGNGEEFNIKNLKSNRNECYMLYEKSCSDDESEEDYDEHILGKNKSHMAFETEPSIHNQNHSKIFDDENTFVSRTVQPGNFIEEYVIRDPNTNVLRCYEVYETSCSDEGEDDYIYNESSSDSDSEVMHNETQSETLSDIDESQNDLETCGSTDSALESYTVQSKIDLRYSIAASAPEYKDTSCDNHKSICESKFNGESIYQSSYKNICL
ncbi:uncharacterized protein LOC119677679 isoform X2 [Teleopsis dalmanni]|nr:uncharacterized protein LOC119677679 isoform X2 [Teleopsis dalmanni]